MDVLLLGGTTEGVQLSEKFQKERIPTLVSVTTGYGKSQIRNRFPPEPSHVRIRVGPLDKDAFHVLLNQEDPRVIVDATHPYATRISEMAHTAAEERNLPYFHLTRPVIPLPGDSHIHVVDDLSSAVRTANQIGGQIFSTTGSRSLPDIPEDISLENLVVRTIPQEKSLKICRDIGLTGDQIICMQGPFSKELNRALFRAYNISCVISKRSGKAGGVPEKYEATRDLGLHFIVIERPETPVSRTFYRVDSLLSHLNRTLNTNES